MVVPTPVPRSPRAATPDRERSERKLESQRVVKRGHEMKRNRGEVLGQSLRVDGAPYSNAKVRIWMSLRS
jgi:hypothetical protein